jgi:MFS family permease
MEQVDRPGHQISPSAPPELASATYRKDLLRAPFAGILEAGWATFALVIAIRYFDASDTYKAFIAGAAPIGFLLTPLTLYLAANLRATPSRACTFVFALAAFLLVGASLAQSLFFFTLFVVMSQVAAVQQGPLMLQIYTSNYASTERGERMTWPFVLTALFSIGFAFLGGRILDQRIGVYHWIFISMALAAVISAAACIKIPSRQLSRKHVGNPWQNFRLIWEDRLFGFLLASWMLLGLGNLIALPIRVEYLADPAYGVDASNTSIAILMLVVPSIARILSTKMWGHFFDRLHFVTTRNLLNIFFLASIACFFFTTNIYILALAMAFQGMAFGGGRIFWSLWVTKIAPDEKASSYMSIHMALTGLRGTLAPFIGYAILSRSTPSSVGIAGMLLILVSIVLFESVRGHTRLRA